jgi:hypothetical protein
MPAQHCQTYNPQEEPAPQGVAQGCSRSRVLGRLSRARSTLIVLTLISRSAVAGPADPPTALAAQDAARLAQAAQMIVRVTLIGRNCAPFYAVDQTQLQEIGTGLFKQALARYGQDQLLRAMETAEAEDTAQIRESGAAFWCPLQRAYLNSLRMPGLIGRQRQ